MRRIPVFKFPRINRKIPPLVFVGDYRSLLDAAGEILLLMNLITYNGKALTATITATFQAKRTEMTNERSAGTRSDA